MITLIIRNGPESGSIPFVSSFELRTERKWMIIYE